MPEGDRTGPLGMGSTTGRGMGYCTGFTGFGSFGKSHGRGFGRTCLIAGLIGLGTLLLSKKRRNF